MLLLVYFAALAGLALIVTVAAWLRLRRLRERAVVQTLATIVGQNLPLVTGLRAAARQERGALRRVFDNMARHIEDGAALSTALRCALVSCSGRVVGALQGAERGGTVPAILRSLALEQRYAQVSQNRFAPALPYFALLIVVYPAITFTIIVFLVPKFRAIFADFGVDSLPAITESLVTISNVAVNHVAWIGLALLVLALIAVQAFLGRHFWARKPDLFQWPFVLLDTLSWHLPICRRVAQVRALARQLPIMQAAVRAGEDLPAAAQQAACVDANHYARRRLRRWAEAIEQGGDPADMARRLRLPTPVVVALRSARGERELPAALDYLSSYYRSLLVHWEQVAASIVVPTTVLLFGVCFGYVVLAFYLPLRFLLDSVMAGMY
jgi:type IV pilus assembly protein PilC